MRVQSLVRPTLTVSLLLILLPLLPSAQALGWPRGPRQPAALVEAPGAMQHGQSPLLDGSFTIRSQLDGYRPPSATPASPLPASASTQEQTLIAVADACIMQGRPSLNLGATSDMWVGFDESAEPPTAPARVVRSLIHFDLPDLGPGVVIDDAELRVYLVNSWDIPGTRMEVSAHRIPTSWSEMSVSWSNAPLPAEEYDSDDVTHGEWGWYEFEVTELAQAWYDGTYPNNGIMLRGEEERRGRRGFSTREGPFAPELVIDFGSGQGTPTTTASVTATRPAGATGTPTVTTTATRPAEATGTPTGTTTATRPAGATGTPTGTTTATATRPSATFSAYLPMVLKAFWRQGPTATPTLTPIAVPTLEPCPDGYLEYRGTTDQNRPVGLCIKPDFSAVTRASLNFSISCNRPDYGASTLWERSSDDGWPIVDRAFRIEAYLTFDLTGTFTADFAAVNGTWQGIEGVCSGFPGPCREVCRGPIGSWSATRQ